MGVLRTPHATIKLLARQLANALDLGWHPADLLDPRKRGSAVVNPDGILSTAAVETLNLMISSYEKKFPVQHLDQKF